MSSAPKKSGYRYGLPRRRPTSLRLRHNKQPLYRVSFDEMGLHDRVYIIGDARRISHAFCMSDQ
jgi:hypothetical protein